MSGICAGRVVSITGAGRGLARAHALAFAREGARLVINDTGVERDGTGGDHGPADAVVAEIRELGGEAVANYEDAADWDGAARLIQAALASYGQLDVLVNNAGILRDRAAAWPASPTCPVRCWPSPRCWPAGTRRPRPSCCRGWPRGI